MFDFFRRTHARHAVRAGPADLPVVRLLRHPGLQPVHRAATSRRSPRSTASKISAGRVGQRARERVERVRQQMPNLDAKLFETPEMRRRRSSAWCATACSPPRPTSCTCRPPTSGCARAVQEPIPQFAHAAQPGRQRQPRHAGRAGHDARDVRAAAAPGHRAAPGAAGPRRHRRSRRPTRGSAALDAMYEQREVQVQRFDAKDYLAKVTPTDAELEAYYKDPRTRRSSRRPSRRPSSTSCSTSTR